MTTPVDITTIVPSKAKTWVGLLGSFLSFVIPYVLTVSDSLPSPWPVVVGAFVAVLTALGIYRAPYKPQGTVLAPESAVQPTTPVVVADPASQSVTNKTPTPNNGLGYSNPWR